MPRYKAYVTRKVLQEAYVVVDADSEEGAEEELASKDWNTFPWQTLDEPDEVLSDMINDLRLMHESEEGDLDLPNIEEIRSMDVDEPGILAAGALADAGLLRKEAIDHD